MTNRAIGIVLLALTSTPLLAQAQNADRPAPFSSNLEVQLADWQGRHGDAWHVLANRATGTLEMLYGGSARAPFEPNTNVEADWFRLARHWIVQTAPMHGVDVADLSDGWFRYLPLGQGNGTDKITVRLRQEIGGVPVEDGIVNCLFNTRGDLLSLHTTAAPAGSLADRDPRPTIDAGFASLVAREAFVDTYGTLPDTSETPELMFAPIDDQETRRWTLGWKVNLQHLERATPVGHYYMVDAHGRSVLKLADSVHFLMDVTGTVQANATTGLEADRAGNPPAPQAMPYIRVQSSAGNVVTDRNGDFTIAGVNTPVNITLDFYGNYADSNHDQGSDYSITFNSVQPNQANTLLMNPTPGQFRTAEANAFLHNNVLRDWIRDRVPSDGTADFRKTANCNISSSCNAFFNGNSTNYYHQAGNCNNTAFTTVVAHEVGHWMNVLYNTGNGSDGMGEGNADVWAMYIYDDPIVGRFFTTSGGFVRTGTNNRQYCGDGNGGCYGAVHTDGEVWMGAAWKVRTQLNNSLGNSLGDMTADLLFLGWMNSYNQSTITSAIEIQWLTLDDDDGDINNGTPNYSPINDGFVQQGFPGFDLPFVTFANVTQLPDTADETGPYTVDADISAGVNTSINAADLVYRVNGGGWNTVPMSSTGGNGWTGDIPGQISVADVDYYLVGTDDMGNSESFPDGGAASPLGFKIGTIIVFHKTDFEAGGNEGWVSGAPGDNNSTGDWERGNPIGTQAQPENDHSSPGTQCWFTGQGSAGGSLGENDVDGGTTTLLSPVFDASNTTNAEVGYWRWYSNDTGADPNNDVFVVDISSDGGSSWTNVEVVGPSGVQSNGGWFENSFRIDAFVTPTSTMRVRFVASDLSSGSIVEAAIDDFCAQSVEPSTQPPTNYCTSNPNSTGNATTITWFGSNSIGANDFTLSALSATPNAFGLFFFGDMQTQTPIPSSDGLLCVAGTVYRLPVVSTDPLFGSASYALDYTDMSTSASLITSGSVWNFQFWHRDATPNGSNTSDGLSSGFRD